MSSKRLEKFNQIMHEWSRFYYDDRDLLIYIMSQNGFTYEELGEILDVKRQAIHMYVNAARKRIASGEITVPEKFLNRGGEKK